MELFQSKRKAIIGLDISFSAIKLVSVETQKQNFCVTHYGQEPLSKNAFIGNKIKDLDEVAHSIQKIYSQLNIKSKKVVLALPHYETVNTVLKMEGKVDEQRLEALIATELQQLPYSVKDAYFDYYIQGSQLFIIAAKASLVNNRLDVLARAGLEVMVVETEAYSITRAVQRQIDALFAIGSQKVIAVVSVNNDSIHLLVVHNGTFIFSQHSFEEKINYLQAIQSLFEAFYTMHRYYFIDHILLSGQITLQKEIQEKFKITTTIANPFLGLSINPTFSKKLLDEGHSLLIASGLALKQRWAIDRN